MKVCLCVCVCVRTCVCTYWIQTNGVRGSVYSLDQDQWDKGVCMCTYWIQTNGAWVSVYSPDRDQWDKGCQCMILQGSAAVFQISSECQGWMACNIRTKPLSVYSGRNLPTQPSPGCQDCNIKTLSLSVYSGKKLITQSSPVSQTATSDHNHFQSIQAEASQHKHLQGSNC